MFRFWEPLRFLWLVRPIWPLNTSLICKPLGLALTIWWRSFMAFLTMTWWLSLVFLFVPFAWFVLWGFNPSSFLHSCWWVEAFNLSSSVPVGWPLGSFWFGLYVWLIGLFVFIFLPCLCLLCLYVFYTLKGSVLQSLCLSVYHQDVVSILFFILL